jgi:hypothetical protein
MLLLLQTIHMLVLDSCMLLVLLLRILLLLMHLRLLDLLAHENLTLMLHGLLHGQAERSKCSLLQLLPRILLLLRTIHMLVLDSCMLLVLLLRILLLLMHLLLLDLSNDHGVLILVLLGLLHGQAEWSIRSNAPPPSPPLGPQRQRATRMQGIASHACAHIEAAITPCKREQVVKDERQRLQRLETAARAPGPFAYLCSRLVVFWS